MGVIARVLEAAGLATTSISLVREHTEKVRPPRALFVPYAFGYTLGQPGEPDLQGDILRRALGLLTQPQGPVLADYADASVEGEELTLPQSSTVAAGRAPSADVAFEVTALRPYYERWVAAQDGRTGVGISGVEQRRFRGLVRLLEAYAGGVDADLPARPPDVPLAQFVRWAADDLKAFYFEARLAQRPSSSARELHTWFWGETAMGMLLRAVADRMRAAEDPKVVATAAGVAR